jgi:hypothetical protein
VICTLLDLERFNVTDTAKMKKLKKTKPKSYPYVPYSVMGSFKGDDWAIYDYLDARSTRTRRQRRKYYESLVFSLRHMDKMVFKLECEEVQQ